MIVDMVFKICLGFSVCLGLYSVAVLRPQVRELERKLNLPEFQGTAHYRTMEFSCRSLRRRSARVRVLTGALGLLTLGWFLRFLWFSVR